MTTNKQTNFEAKLRELIPLETVLARATQAYEHIITEQAKECTDSAWMTPAKAMPTVSCWIGEVFSLMLDADAEALQAINTDAYLPAVTQLREGYGIVHLPTAKRPPHETLASKSINTPNAHRHALMIRAPQPGHRVHAGPTTAPLNVRSAQINAARCQRSAQVQV